MHSITSLNYLNLKPVITITHKGLEAIKHLVSIAPQEAQWFHTVTPVTRKESPGIVYLELSEKLYIPKQNTSLAQVDSTSSMMMDFYKELRQEYQDQELINSKLSSMTCWCHSHHNMSPSPSSQDHNQFVTFINNSNAQQQNVWQVMLIFNKKDNFYSRVYDPESGLIIEGVEIQYQNDYDFSYIDAAAKTKFIYPKKKVNSLATFTKSISPAQFDLFSNFSEANSLQQSAKDIAVDISYELFPSLDILDSAKLTTKKSQNKFFTVLSNHFELRELEFFYYLLNKDKQTIFSNMLVSDSPINSLSQLKAKLGKFMSTTTYNVQDITKYLTYTLESEETFSAMELKLLVERALND